MGFLDFLRPRKKTLLDQIEENPMFQKQKAIFEAMNLLCQDGCETDEIPGAYGEFGHEASNPILTQTVFGSTSYLARLHAPDGAKVVYGRMGSLSSPVSLNPIDAYRISHPDGTQLATLYLSPYRKRTSAKAPEGFTLWRTILG